MNKIKLYLIDHLPFFTITLFIIAIFFIGIIIYSILNGIQTEINNNGGLGKSIGHFINDIKSEIKN